MNATGSGSCTLVGFGISGVETFVFCCHRVSYFGFHKFQYILKVQNIAGDSKNINQNRTTSVYYLKVKDEIKNRFDIFKVVRIHIAVFCIMTSALVGRYQPSA